MINLVTIFEWALSTSLKTLPLILVVFLLQRYAKKFVKASNIHYLWLLVLVCLCLPVGWQFTAVTSELQHTPTLESFAVSSQAEGNEVLSQPEVKTAITQSESDFQQNGNEKISINILLFFSLVWLGGIAILLTAIAWQNLPYRHFKNLAVAVNESLDAQLEALKSRMGIGIHVSLLISEEISSPITFGFRRPVILLPSKMFKQLDSQNIEHILLHELTHIKRRDIAFCWGASLITILHWFNPAAWFALKTMRKNLEIACDAEALTFLQKTEYRKYGETLISVSDKTAYSQHGQLAVGILENHTDLKERITMITQNPIAGIKSRLLFIFVAAFIAVTAIAQPQLNDKKSSSIEKGDPNTIELREFSLQAERDLKTTVLMGQEFANEKIRVSKDVKKLDYGKLLSVLRVNGYTAFRTKDVIKIIPIKEARSSAIPVVTANGQYEEDEYVTEHIVLHKACASKLLPTVRPIIPQQSHLASMVNGSLLITDTYGNIQRLKQIIKSIEDNMDEKEACGRSPDNEPSAAKNQKKDMHSKKK